MLKQDLYEANKTLNQKIEEYEQGFVNLKESFEKSKGKLLEKYKRLKVKYRTLEIEKNDNKARYEGFIDALNEKIYKIEGKKYFYTNKFINTLKVNDKSKSYSQVLMEKLERENSKNKSNRKSPSKTPEKREKLGRRIPSSNKRPMSKNKNSVSLNSRYLEHGPEVCERYERLEQERQERIEREERQGKKAASKYRNLNRSYDGNSYEKDKTKQISNRTQKQQKESNNRELSNLSNISGLVDSKVDMEEFRDYIRNSNKPSTSDEKPNKQLNNVKQGKPPSNEITRKQLKNNQKNNQGVIIKDFGSTFKQGNSDHQENQENKDNEDMEDYGDSDDLDYKFYKQESQGIKTGGKKLKFKAYLIFRCE